MLNCTLLNLLVFTNFNLLNLTLAAFLHLSAEVLHLFLVLELNFVADSFVVASDGTHLFVVSLVECINIFLLTRLLLFLLDFECSEILLKLAFLDSVFILRVLKCDLSLLLEVGELISVLEHQMHKTLHVNLNFNLMFLFEILKLSLFVTELSFFIFKLLLTDHPEVRDSNTLIIVHVS